MYISVTKREPIQGFETNDQKSCDCSLGSGAIAPSRGRGGSWLSSRFARLWRRRSLPSFVFFPSPQPSSLRGPKLSFGEAHFLLKAIPIVVVCLRGCLGWVDGSKQVITYTQPCTTIEKIGHVLPHLHTPGSEL